MGVVSRSSRPKSVLPQAVQVAKADAILLRHALVHRMAGGAPAPDLHRPRPSAATGDGVHQVLKVGPLRVYGLVVEHAPFNKAKKANLQKSSRQARQAYIHEQRTN